MAEEVPDPSIVVPQSVMFTMLVNGSCGFAMLIAVLFCMGDVEKAMHTPTGYPLMEIFQQATKSVIGAAVMSSIIAIMGICATVGLFASTSRVTWSFARDRGLPFWRTISKVRRGHYIPGLMVLFFLFFSFF
jgi:amino acid transporter